MSSVLTNAAEIKKKAFNKRIINKYILSILRLINKDIINAVNSGERESITQIPTSFDISTLSNKMAQQYIYYHLLKELEKAKFKPRIIFQGRKAEDQKVFICVKWLTKKDEKFYKYMDEYIKARIDHF